MRGARFASLAALAALAATLLLSGCSTLREWFNAGAQGAQGTQPVADSRPQPAVDPALRAELDSLHKQGADALLGNNLDGAIVAWRRYVAAAPSGLAEARRLRGYLTLLDRQAARQFARAAVARERATAAVAGRLHVAVFPFVGQSPGATGFSRAAAALITADLAQVPALTVLERARIEQLLQEQRLAGSGLVDPATASARGQLLGAGTVIAGSVLSEPGPAGPGSGRYKINTAMSDVGAGRLLATQEAAGQQAEFFRLEKQIVYGILEALGITELPPRVHKVHTRSWAAYARFATGLQLMAEDRFDEARAAFQAALQADPAFELAEQALWDTPEQGLGIDEIRARVRNDGPR
jgi:tetratricopeptide (TPR) repeat protein